MKVFLDTNIILDLLLEREGWEAAARIITLQEKGLIHLCVSVLTMVNAAYVYRKTVGEQLAVANLKYLSAFLEVLPMDEKMMDEAFFASDRDFEDAFQAVTAATAGCDAIVTRNIRDFEHLTPQGHPLPALFTPASLLALDDNLRSLGKTLSGVTEHPELLDDKARYILSK